MPRRHHNTFDSRPKRHSRHSDPERPRRHSRRSRQEELWPPEWSQVETQVEPVNQAEKKKGKCCKRIRLYISVLFLLAYLALVGLLMSMILSEKQLLEAPGKDSAECREKICPIESPCQIQENEARCVFVSLANLRALEVILGLVIGVPLVICIPCTLHCVIRRIRGKSWGPKTSKSTKSTSGHEAKPGPSVLGRAEEDVESQDSTQALKTSMATPAADDGLEDLFTRLAKNPEEEATKEAENELDLLFAPKPKGYTAKKHDPPATPSIISSALESEFSALFHRKPKGKGKGRSAGRHLRPGESDAASDLHSNLSEGMSVLFASLKRLQGKDGASGVIPHALAQAKSTASSDHQKLAPKAMSTIGESEDWLDAIDLGDPPDFFQFALQIARRATGNIRDEDPLERRDSDDSLGHLEEDDLEELFHPPL